MVKRRREKKRYKRNIERILAIIVFDIVLAGIGLVIFSFSIMCFLSRAEQVLLLKKIRDNRCLHYNSGFANFSFREQREFYSGGFSEKRCKPFRR